MSIIPQNCIEKQSKIIIQNYLFVIVEINTADYYYF